MVQEVCEEVWDEGKHPPSLPLLCCPFASPGGFALAQTRLRISAVTQQLAADRILSSPWAPAPSVRAPGRTLWRGPFLNPPVPAVVCALQPRALPPVLVSPPRGAAADTGGKGQWAQPVGTNTQPPLGPCFGGVEVGDEQHMLELPSERPLLYTGSWANWEGDKLHLRVPRSVGIYLA